MNKAYKLLACIFLAILLPFSAYATENGIKVVGTSKVSIAPDIAKFTLAINERGNDLASVKNGIDEKTSKVVNLCKKLGVEAKNISSSEVSIHPQYNYQTKKFLGFEVSRKIKVTLNDLKKYTALVNGSIESGITTIRGITLDTTKRMELELRALESASNSAKGKALSLAKSNGLSLGKVLSIEESGIPNEERTYLYKENRAAIEQKGGAFEPGEITVSATVVVRYSIK